MAAYYARRAAEYERIYHKPERQAELRALEASLAPLFAGRRVLEIACGTGWWTPHGARRAAHWRATDLSPETIAIAQAKPKLPASVQFQVANAYSLAELDAPAAPEGQHEPGAASTGTPFDAAFAGCWWSHVPLARLPAWLNTLHARLQPGARVVVLDNCFVPGSSTAISRTDAQGNTYQRRTLDDGSTHEVVKNFPAPEQAIAALGHRAQDVRWTQHTHYWVLQYRLA